MLGDWLRPSGLGVGEIQVTTCEECETKEATWVVARFFEWCDDCYKVLAPKVLKGE